MKLSDLELSAYDLAAIILPGAIGIAEIGITIHGLTPFWEWVNHISLSGGFVLILASFGLGHLVSQAAFECATFGGRKRTHRQARDKHWKQNGDRISVLLRTRHNIEIHNNSHNACDTAFDHCLTVIGNTFDKRKVFSLVAALSLSIWILSVLALLPAMRGIYIHKLTLGHQILATLGAIFICTGCALLAWRRSQLYFFLADVTVFNVFEASSSLDAHPRSNEDEQEM